MIFGVNFYNMLKFHLHASSDILETFWVPWLDYKKFRLNEKAKSSIWVKKCWPARGSEVWVVQCSGGIHLHLLVFSFVYQFHSIIEALVIICKWPVQKYFTIILPKWVKKMSACKGQRGLSGSVSESDVFIERPLKMTSFIVKHGCGQPLTATR